MVEALYWVRENPDQLIGRTFRINCGSKNEMISIFNAGILLQCLIENCLCAAKISGNCGHRVGWGATKKAVLAQ